MPHTQGRPHGRPQGRPHATEQTPGSTLEHAGYLWVLMVAALALCASILVISLNVVNADLPFYYRFQFATSLQHYTAPSSRLELHPNLCMVRSAPACGTPVPLSTDSLPQCQVSCDGEGLCECKYLDEYPAYGREVLMGQNCSRAVAAVLETGECTCVEAELIRAAFWLLATSTALMGAVPLVASVLILPCSFLCYCLWCMCPRFCQVRWERLCRSAGFRRAQARLMLLLIFAWQLGSVRSLRYRRSSRRAVRLQARLRRRRRGRLRRRRPRHYEGSRHHELGSAGPPRARGRKHVWPPALVRIQAAVRVLSIWAAVRGVGPGTASDKHRSLASKHRDSSSGVGCSQGRNRTLAGGA